MSSRDAQKLADEAELDLIKIAPKAKPPVCKIMDYGKFRYEQQKREKEAKKKQHVVETKEIRLSPNVEMNDLKTKANNARKFITKGDIENIPIFIPKDKKYLSYFNELVLTQEHILSENDELTNLRDWLLPMLMNGQATIEN